jgi:hypothetical protein
MTREDLEKRVRDGGGEGWRDIATAPRDATPVLVASPGNYPNVCYFSQEYGWVDSVTTLPSGATSIVRPDPQPLVWMPLIHPPTPDAIDAMRQLRAMDKEEE